MRPSQVGLVGDSEANPAACAAAEQIGAFLAQQGMTLVTGGRGGVMEAAARGAARNGGLTVGIVPSSQLSEANPWCRVVISTGMGHARNVLTALSSDVVIALGGGAGTLTEIAFAWIHGRPIVTLAGHDGWADRLAGAPLDPRGSSRILHCDSLSGLLETVARLCGQGGEGA